MADSRLADWLGGRPFLMGDRPVEVDCTAFAFVANLLMPSVFHGPLQNEAHRHPNLAAYSRRMLERFFPEWADARAARPKPSPRSPVALASPG